MNLNSKEEKMDPSSDVLRLERKQVCTVEAVRLLNVADEVDKARWLSVAISLWYRHKIHNTKITMLSVTVSLCYRHKIHNTKITMIAKKLNIKRSRSLSKKVEGQTQR